MGDSSRFRFGLCFVVSLPKFALFQTWGKRFNLVEGQTSIPTKSIYQGFFSLKNQHKQHTVTVSVFPLSVDEVGSLEIARNDAEIARNDADKAEIL